MISKMYSSYMKGLKQHWLQYFLGIFFLLLTSFTEVLIPKFIQWATDLLTGSKIPDYFVKPQQSDTLNHLMLLFVATLVLAWIGRIGWRQTLARRTHGAGHELKVGFWDALRFQPLAFLQHYSFGDLMNRATGDWNKSRFIHGFTMVLTFDVIFFMALSLISMAMIDMELTVACLIIVPFLPKTVVKLSQQEYVLHQKAQEKLSTLSDQISQSVNTIRLQRATATSAIWEHNLIRQASVYAKAQFKVLEMGWKIFLIGAFPTIIAYFILFTYGLYKYDRGAISLGELLALQSYILLLQSPLFELGSVISEWQTGFASYKRLFHILKQKISPYRAPDILPDSTATTAIRTKLLTYSYHERPSLKNIDLEIRSGEKIGIMGSIGSGKTTLINTIAGLLPDYKGCIELLEKDISSLDRETLSQMIAIVPQKPFLFAGSIRFNLCLNKAFSDEELIAVLKSVRLWEEIEDMGQGLDTLIGEWGINLSGGQKQRLTIARAILRSPQILLLDDCLSAVDSVTEQHIHDHIASYIEFCTVIWTAHRLSSLALCHRIFSLNDGKLTPLAHEGA